MSEECPHCNKKIEISDENKITYSFSLVSDIVTHPFELSFEPDNVCLVFCEKCERITYKLYDVSDHPANYLFQSSVCKGCLDKMNDSLEECIKVDIKHMRSDIYNIVKLYERIRENKKMLKFFKKLSEKNE